MYVMEYCKTQNTLSILGTAATVATDLVEN